MVFGPKGNAIHHEEIESTAKQTTTLKRSLRYYVSKLVRLWMSLQLSHHGGEYSIERLVALDEYTQRTSFSKVLLICLATPLPMVLITVLQEMVPLQNISEGWRLNFGFWFRFALLIAVLTHAMAVHGPHMVGGLSLSSRQLVALDIGVCVGILPVAMAIADSWTFPIPFIQISLNMVFVVVVIGLFRIVVGSAAFHKFLARRKRLARYLSFIFIQVFMTILYPTYQVLFERAADTSYELAVLILLPVIKIVMKNVLSMTVSHMEDLVPETVIFTVDFFNALYLATCMQRASSTTTVVVIMTADLYHAAFALFRLHRSTKTVLAQLQQATDSTTRPTSLLSEIRLLYHNPKKLKRQARGGIQVYSYRPHRLSTAGSFVLENVEGFTKVNRQTKSQGFLSLGAHFDNLKPNWKKTIEVRPEEISSFASERTSSVLLPPTMVLHDTLEVFFTSECLVLAEYLEVVIPLLYGNYMMMMVHLPNAKYHTELDGVTTTNVTFTVQTVFIYGLLELLSFGALVFILQRNCGMRALHQLAFVLETHMPLIQTKLMAWVLVTLSYRVLHFGVDFTFQFLWLHDKVNE